MIQDLLIEIGTEELPPTSLRDLATAFGKNIEDQLDELGIAHEKGTIFCTPRRLAVLIHQVRSQQKAREVIRRGPSVNTAFTSDGYPTKAMEGFARSCGVDVKELATYQSDKGAWIIFRSIEAGQTTEHFVPQIVEKALMGLPIAKRMRWGAGEELFIGFASFLVIIQYKVKC
jgi:glycyl-tRNA synthetase beta chain